MAEGVDVKASATALRRQIQRETAKAIERSRAELDRRVERKRERAPSATIRALSSFGWPTPIEMRTVMTHDAKEGTYVTVHLGGLRLISELNRREHHMLTHKRKTSQQEIVHYAMWQSDLWEVFGLPLVVTITRLAPKLIRDDDNLTSCAKHVRDQVAKELGVDDGDPRVSWVVTQRREERYGVEIRFEARVI